ELLKLGLRVSQATVSKYMLRHRKPPSQTWRMFLRNHAKDLIALDCFTVPTATFRVLFVLLVLSHDRRRILLSLRKDAPEPRSVQAPSQGGVVEVPRVGGLHHEYARMAA
ncbi:MAG: hypothetical protein ACE5JD_12880, partial [Candidatus Methylomirabilia bacterium]